MGLNDFLKSMFGSKSDRDLKKLRPILQKIKQVHLILLAKGKRKRSG